MRTCRFIALLVGVIGAGSCLEQSVSEVSSGIDESLELEHRAVYGDDDRLNYDEVDSPAIRRVADSVAAMIMDSKMTCDDDDCFVKDVLKVQDLEFTGLLGPGGGLLQVPLCEDARFLGQSKAGFCTAFLVEPDLVMTAGHCLTPESGVASPCEGYKFVFGYNSSASFEPSTSLGLDNVYSCKEVVQSLVSHDLHGPNIKDWALVRLDRPVVDRRPIGPMRVEGSPSPDRLIMIGHPLGLTKKISLNGRVIKDFPDRAVFTVDLESEPSSSGSPVIGPDGTVEGILLGGSKRAWLFDTKDNCYRGAKCLETDYYRPICEQEGKFDLSLYSYVMRMPAFFGSTKCNNGALDEGEQDVDCGSACGPCPDGSGCSAGKECASGVCMVGACLPASCFDRVRNQGELQIDWGGPCPKTDEGYPIETFENDERWVFDDQDSKLKGSSWEISSRSLVHSYFLSSFGQFETASSPLARTVLEGFPGSETSRMKIKWSVDQTLLGLGGFPDIALRLVIKPLDCGSSAQSRTFILRGPYFVEDSFSAEDTLELSPIFGGTPPNHCLLELKIEPQPRLQSWIFAMLFGRIEIREITVIP